MEELKRALMALRLEVDGSIVDSIQEIVASAITSAVEQERAKLQRIAEHRLKCAVEAERERAAKIAENGMAYSSGIEIATAIRQTPTQEGV